MILIIDVVLFLVVIYLGYILERKWMTVYVGFDPTNKYWNYFLCDGVADDVQIQAALDALPRWGGLVNLSGGTFSVENELQTKRRAVLKGES